MLFTKLITINNLIDSYSVSCIKICSDSIVHKAADSLIYILLFFICESAANFFCTNLYGLQYNIEKK